MSKSKKNVVSPDDIIDQYGADTVRVFSLFAAPPEKDIEWSDQGVEGAFRFINRLWTLVYLNLSVLKMKPSKSASSAAAPRGSLFRKTHQTIRKVTTAIEKDYHFNTAIASLMELLNDIYAFKSDSEENRSTLRFALSKLVLLLSPFAPHASEELWHEMGNVESVFVQPWPEWDLEAVKEADVELVVQIDGKVRGKQMIPAGLPEESIKALALQNEKVREHLAGKSVKNVMVVRGKLVSIVTEKQ